MTLSLSRRQLLTFGAAAALFTALGSLPGGLRGRLAGAALAEGPFLVPEMSMGDPNAPVKVVEYGMFTCPHCANFNAAVMPVLRREWIETGKMRLIHRHFPSDGVATRASVLAECSGPDKFFDAVDTLFRTQVQWMTAPDPATELLTVLADFGVTPEGAAACVANDRLLDKVINDVQSGQMLGVRFTPTVFINEQNYGNPGGADAIAAILRQVGR